MVVGVLVVLFEVDIVMVLILVMVGLSVAVVVVVVMALVLVGVVVVLVVVLFRITFTNFDMGGGQLDTLGGQSSDRRGGDWCIICDKMWKCLK